MSLRCNYISNRKQFLCSVIPSIIRAFIEKNILFHKKNKLVMQSSHCNCHPSRKPVILQTAFRSCWRSRPLSVLPSPLPRENAIPLELLRRATRTWGGTSSLNFSLLMSPFSPDNLVGLELKVLLGMAIGEEGVLTSLAWQCDETRACWYLSSKLVSESIVCAWIFSGHITSDSRSSSMLRKC